MVKDNESPHVLEVDEHDLLSWDLDEETGEGYWCSSRHGAVGHVVTAADRDRDRAGFVHTETFEMSLAWLDDVIKVDRHGDFARLGKVRAALARRDHGRAVTEGFGICEIRCMQKHLRPRQRRSAKDCIDDLEADAILDAATAARLQSSARRGTSSHMPGLTRAEKRHRKPWP